MHFLCVASAAHFLFLERTDIKMKTKTKTKQILSALLALLMLFGALPATVFAAEKTNPLDYLTYEIADGEVTITDCDTSVSGKLTIPETIEGYPVTKIGWNAFEYRRALTNVIIPDSVTYIDDSAFRYCSGLISMVIPDSVTYISEYAFDGCTSLTSVTISNSLTSIGWSVFGSCTGLTNITIPNSVTSIGEYAFYGCTGLTSIIIPNSVTDIHYSAFRGCTDLTSIKVSENNKVYDSRNNCNAIIETKTDQLIIGCQSTIIPNNIKIIGIEAFAYCTCLTNITIPNSVTIIGDYAFENCTGLTGVTISNGVTSICDYAFENCTGLTSITIPHSVTNIDEYAFNSCTGLTSILFSNNIKHLGEAVLNNTAYYNNDLNWENDILYIDKYLVDAKKDIAGSRTVKNGTKLIADGAFSSCESLTDITIPDSVTSIGEGAFFNTAYSKDDSNWEDGILYIGKYLICAKEDIAGSRTVKNGTKLIANCAFYCCGDLTDIKMPNSVTSIGESAFCKTGLTNITIPNSITNISANTFNGCISLTSITIPDSVTNIDGGAFWFCKSLTNVTIPNSVTNIDANAFGQCHDLTSVTIPSSVTSIGKHAFGYRITLDYKEIKIPNFKIYCYAGTAGEQYAKDNGFEYEILKEECSHILKHITVPASCTVNGMEYDLCTECGDTFNSKVIAALGHSWGNWYVSKQPTESADGEETRKCTRCSAIEKRKIEKLKTVKDEKTGVEIIYKDEFESGVDLEVSQVFDGKSFQLISANYGDVKSAVFDISTYKDGVKVQPNGKIKVRIPLPQGFGSGNVFVCYVDSENGEVQKIKATVNGGYVEFEAEHFSEYAVVETVPSVKGVDIKDIKLTYKKSEKIKPNITADEGAKYTVKYESSTPKVASVDKNGKLTALKKGSAKITGTVTDSNGNTVSDTCNVTVKYNFGQWLIIILLFGWIWYI